MKPNFRLKFDADRLDECSLCLNFIDEFEDKEDFYVISPHAKTFNCARCKFKLCQICTQSMTADEEISNNLVINKCPKCEVIGARRSWYPPILHTLTAPINFVAS